MLPKLLAAVPTHSGSIIIEGAETLLAVQELVLRRGGSFKLHYEFGATISLVRNAIIAEFLAGDAELLLMLDADQVIDAATIGRMIDLGQPMVGAIYPRRMYDFSRVRPDMAANTDQLVYQAMDFVGWLDADADGKVELVDGFGRAAHVGTGILLLRREMLTRMMIEYPELRGRGFGEDAYPQYNSGGRWGFFNPLDREDGVPLSEDLSFCRRWRAMGGEIWADVTSTSIHVGRHLYMGNYADFLMTRGSIA